MPHRTKLFDIARAVVTVSSACIVGACTAEVETAHPVVATQDEAVVEAEAVPPSNVYASPHTEYRGRTVYFVNGRWYYPQANRWYYYRNEPAELVRHRRYVQQAPPAARVYEPGPGEAVRVR